MRERHEKSAIREVSRGAAADVSGGHWDCNLVKENQENVERFSSNEMSS
jgi:hypothetical protein